MSDLLKVLRLQDAFDDRAAELCLKAADRIEELEAQNKRQANEVSFCRQRSIEDERRIKELKAENERLRAALDKLARLGNEPYYGNSDGNVIAQRALAAVGEASDE